ncbi:MAG: DUF1016 N-terminal domain-containing protein [Bacteroidales bacterium]|jgi:predicted nuclease of restriction endonuclease-like (RecB) superfamily|nr:DUF1016 N-terminal domain-containing protein [Bacteroidales bacterium]
MTDLKTEDKKSFKEILAMIKESRARAAKVVNNELIDLYWRIGGYISAKCKDSGWGSLIVGNLSDFLQETEPNTKGFSSQNLWRMKQFYETYYSNKKLSPLVREIGWTNNMIIVAQAKTEIEKEFYLKLTARENYSKKELLRQFESSLFERTMLSKESVSPVARETYPAINEYVRDYYSFEFLKLKDNYSEHSFW